MRADVRDCLNFAPCAEGSWAGRLGPERRAPGQSSTGSVSICGRPPPAVGDHEALGCEGRHGTVETVVREAVALRSTPQTCSSAGLCTRQLAQINDMVRRVVAAPGGPGVDIITFVGPIDRRWRRGRRHSQQCQEWRQQQRHQLRARGGGLIPTDSRAERWAAARAAAARRAVHHGCDRCGVRSRRAWDAQLL
jgi:hypothetical protein